jgi:CheY-like chemotaxis protein
MPELDGLEATQEIRRREGAAAAAPAAAPHIPIIAMTAHAMKGDEDRCLAAGMDAYIAKPIDARQLFDLIVTLIASTRAEPAHSWIGGGASATPAEPALATNECDDPGPVTKRATRRVV